MKIHFTKKEYLILVDMLSLSDWMMHSHETDNKHNEYKVLRKKILGYFKEMGAENRIEYSNKLDNYFETESYDTEIQEKFIDPYDEETFWEALIDRLGKRDVINQMGVDAFEKMDWLERAEIISEVCDSYANEFSQQGLKNLQIRAEETIVN